MTREQEAITYFEGVKKQLKDFRKIYPSPDTVGYQATTKEISFYDMAISALSENKCFDGMTNGEVIQALFPSVVFSAGYSTTRGSNCVEVKGMDRYSQYFDPKWIDSPYRR